MKLSLFTLGTAALAGLASAAAPDGREEVPISWRFPNPNGGEDVYYTGTIEQADAQFKADFPNHKPKPESAKFKARSDTLMARQEQGWEGATYDCIDAKQPAQGWKPAKLDKVQEGWNYLWSQEGKPQASPGPGTCGRVSCSYDAAIWWCNDKPEARELDSFAVIAKGAVELCNACSASTFRDKCGGQIFNTDGFNIVVREDDC